MDDDGMGYADIGEEEDWAAEHGPAKKAKTKRDKKSSEGAAGTPGLCRLPSGCGCHELLPAMGLVQASLARRQILSRRTLGQSSA